MSTNICHGLLVVGMSFILKFTSSVLVSFVLRALKSDFKILFTESWQSYTKPFTGPKMFCAGPNVLSHSKNLIAFSASSKTFVPAQKPI